MSNPDDLDDGLAYDFDAEHEVIFDAKDGSPPTKKVQKRSIEQDDDDVDDIDGKKRREIQKMIRIDLFRKDRKSYRKNQS